MITLKKIRAGTSTAIHELGDAIGNEIYYRINKYALARFILQMGKSYKNLKKTIMKMNNVDYVKNTLKLRGLEDKSLYDKLEKSINQGLAEFSIPHKMAYGKDEVNFQIHFRKGNDDNYRLTKFDAAMKDEQGNERKQTFYHSRNMSTTGKEAYNLLSGRAVNKNLVNKEGEKYNAWVQLKIGETDKYGNNLMDKYNEKWGFKLEEALNKIPIHGLRNENDRVNVINSLMKGNSHMVYIEINGNKEQVFLQANPAARTVDMFNKDMQPVQLVSQKQQYETAKADEMKNDQKQSKQNGKSNKQEQGQEQKQSKRKGIGV